MTSAARTLFVVATALFIAIASAASTDPTYTALRAARPDGRTIAVNDFSFDRDVYHVTLNGTLHLLAPVDGKTVGAVFTGHGAYELTPVSEVERKTLAINAADPSLKTLRDEFDSMTIFDAVLIEQLGKKAVKGAPAPEASDAYERFLSFERKDLKQNVHIRVLQALLNNEAKPLFIAVPAGKKFARVMLLVDPLGVVDGEETSLVSADSNRGGVWYSAHLRGEQPHGLSKLVMAAHYDIDTTFAGRNEMSGTTIIDAMAVGDVRVLPLHLDPRLRVEEVSSAADAKSQSWTPVPFIQENEKEDGDLAVVLPSALKQGDSVFLRVKYHGREVLKDAGDGNFYVQSRESWYPNAGTMTELATYDLTYRFPKAYQVVSVGDSAGDTLAGDQRVMTFKAAEPIRVAGFNVGKFRKISKTDKDTGLTVDVYTNPGTPDIIREINAALESYESGAGHDEHGVTGVGGGLPDMYGGPHHIALDTNGLADSAMADAVNTARVASVYFGSSPLKHVSITQQTQFDYGQSWPGLVYLPYMAVLSSTIRANFGLAGASGFLDEVGPHEMAHQWWGHGVGPATYHDEWLSEGFSDFTASLVLQRTGGPKKYNDFWESARKYIVTKPPRAFIENQEAGPITQGVRLATWRNQSAYQALVYNKGAYVLHMLRLMMQDRSNRENPDAPFIALMSDFARTFNGKNATTADFKAAVERHMVGNLNATGNGKVDWFFDQWVYGTAIPKYTSTFDVKPGSEGKFHITGSIVQSEVPDDFRVMVPIYVEFDRGQIFKIAQIPMIGSTTKPLDFEVKLPKKPSKIMLNAMHDVLTK